MKSHLGHYEVVSELGRGGMGVVYKGYEPSLARYVAIKELSPALAHDPAVVERFLREARSMALLNDPHIIQIYSIGQENDLPFFVMEFVDGISVAALIQRESHLQPGDALKIVHQTAKGLSAAHDRGVIHRDVKPANLILSQRGQVKIADFGIALANADMHQKLTSAGEMVGTPGYLPPELLLGKAVDQRSDVYALGVVLFEMLTGRTPFSDASVYKLMLDVVQTEVPDVREINSDIDPGVAAILAKMLIKDPAKRYQGMQELITDLEKHPLVARGGPLRVQLSVTTPGGETLTGVQMPVMPPPSRRSATPPPAMTRTPAATPAASPAPAPVVPTEVRTRPGLSPQPQPQLQVQAEPAALKKPKAAFPWTLLLMGAAVIASGAAAWVWREDLMRWLATARVPAQLVQGYAGLRDAGAGQLRPLLRQLGVAASPELVFNILAVLLVLLVLRAIAKRMGRARARRAYARGARRID